MWLSRFKDTQIALLGICLMLGLIAAAGLLAYGVVEFKRSADEVITVTGAASRPVKSDLGEWRTTFSRRADTLDDAYTAIQRDLNTVTAYLAEKGIAEKNIKIEPLNTEINYVRTADGYQTSRIEGYTLRQSIEAASKDVDLVETLSTSASDLINRGIILENSYPQYFVTNLDAIKVEMLGEATENAKARAQAMARHTGNRIGLMRSSRMGVFQITGETSTDVSDMGIYDTAAKNKKVTAVVSVSFAIR